MCIIKRVCALQVHGEAREAELSISGQLDDKEQFCPRPLPHTTSWDTGTQTSS